MASVISASTTSGTALSLTADTSGVLEIKTGAAPTTALTLDASQNATFANVINGNGSGITSINAANVSSGVLSQAQGGTGTTTGYYGFKNRIINGAMVIDQRNAGASVTPTASGYTLDRWRAGLSVSSKFSVQQSSTAPTNFKNSLLVTSLSAYSVGSSELFGIVQRIEGFNTADLNWGTANAKTVTVSFWVRSSLTGNFGGGLYNGNADRFYPFTYSISAANTFEYKTVTVAGDTTGTWATDNTTGLQIIFGLGIGSSISGTAGAWTGSTAYVPTSSVSVVGTSGATFYITGVQLEVGSTATSFDYRPYGTELALCQRYCVKYGGSSVFEHIGQGNATNTTTVQFDVTLPTTMRTTPSVTTSGNWFVADGVTNTAVTGFSLASSGTESSPNIVSGLATVASGLTQYRPYFVFPNNSLASSYIISAEL